MLARLEATRNGIAYLHVILALAHQIIGSLGEWEHPGDSLPGRNDNLTFEVCINITFVGDRRRAEGLFHVVLECDGAGERGNGVAKCLNLLTREHPETLLIDSTVMPSVLLRGVRCRFGIIVWASVCRVFLRWWRGNGRFE